jgi:hypothetical protein
MYSLPPFAFSGSSSDESKMFSLGSSDLRGVNDRLGCYSFVNGSNGESVFVDGSNGESVFVDGSFTLENWGNGKGNLGGGSSNGQVGGLDTESQMVSNVVGGLDDTVGINI